MVVTAPQCRWARQCDPIVRRSSNADKRGFLLARNLEQLVKEAGRLGWTAIIGRLGLGVLPLYGAEHTIVGKELESSLFDHELDAKVGDLGWSRFHL